MIPSDSLLFTYGYNSSTLLVGLTPIMVYVLKPIRGLVCASQVIIGYL